MAILVCVLMASIFVAWPAHATHDPNRTATILIGGFDPNGASQSGVYGDDEQEDVVDQIAALVGIPTSVQPGGIYVPRVATMTDYYGDTAPGYYTAQDIADIAQVTAQWGGGVPRYALIVAKYAQHVMQRSGADQVNFVSASFGSAIVRWLIEKNVEGLAANGKVARWLSVEGVLSGNWAASQDNAIDLVEIVQAQPIDVDHMHYDWVDANVHVPRTQADSPYYANILLGQAVSTEDHLNARALTAAMLVAGDFQANDGVQGYEDAYFHSITAQSKFMNLSPTLTFFHDDHYGLRDNHGAWVQVVAFLTQSRRVTITMTSATVNDIHEISVPFFDQRPAEIVFQSSVVSPEAQSRWGFVEPIAQRVREGVATPVRAYKNSGETQNFAHVVFDDFILAGETNLDLVLSAFEIDLELRYGINETIFQPYFADLGGGTLSISTTQPGNYTFQSAEWSCTLSIAIFDYPFELPTNVSAAQPSLAGARLIVVPNPFRSTVRLSVTGLPAATLRTLQNSQSAATLSIYDVRGQLVRRLFGPAARAFVWDGHDAFGQQVATGVYLHRLEILEDSYSGKSYLTR